MLKNNQTFSSFAVKDRKQAKHFYSEVLGLNVEEDWMGLKLLVEGSQPVFVYEKPDIVNANFTVLNFIVADIDKTIDDLVEKGVKFEKYTNLPAGQDDKGVLRGLAAKMGPDIAWFKDPSGNTLSVLQQE